MQELCLTLGIDPIPSHADTYDERHAQDRGRFHVAFYKPRCVLLLRFRHLEHQFVVHLEQHAGGEAALPQGPVDPDRSEEHTSELQSRLHLVCRLLLEKKKKKQAMVCELAW